MFVTDIVGVVLHNLSEYLFIFLLIRFGMQLDQQIGNLLSEADYNIINHSLELQASAHKTPVR